MQVNWRMSGLLTESSGKREKERDSERERHELLAGLMQTRTMSNQRVKAAAVTAPLGTTSNHFVRA